MKILPLCYLLIALLTFQTAVTFYDSHEEPTDIAAFIPPTDLDANEARAHLGGQDSASTILLENLDGQNQDIPELDFCHHCSHCHGCGFAGLPEQENLPAAFGAALFRGSLRFSIPVGHFSTLFRPPITLA